VARRPGRRPGSVLGDGRPEGERCSRSRGAGPEAARTPRDGSRRASRRLPYSTPAPTGGGPETTDHSARASSILSRFYDGRADEEPERDKEAEFRFRKALAIAELRPGERVLDLGSKWGGLGVAARQAGLDVEYLGLDLSAVNVRRAAELGLSVREADLSRRLPVNDGSWDCVFCLELLEHLVSPLGLLQEIRRALADDGRAVISVPSPYNWIEVYRELRGRADPEGHLSSLPTPVMVNVLALAGLRVERRRGTFVRLPRTVRLISTNGMTARSRLYLVRRDDRAHFAGRALEALGNPGSAPGRGGAT
jgi:SAM-dependent methyltransferase